MRNFEMRLNRRGVHSKFGTLQIFISLFCQCVSRHWVYLSISLCVCFFVFIYFSLFSLTESEVKFSEWNARNARTLDSSAVWLCVYWLRCLHVHCNATSFEKGPNSKWLIKWWCRVWWCILMQQMYEQISAQARARIISHNSSSLYFCGPWLVYFYWQWIVKWWYSPRRRRKSCRLESMQGLTQCKAWQMICTINRLWDVHEFVSLLKPE